MRRPQNLLIRDLLSRRGFNRKSSCSSKLLPCFQYQPPGAVFAVLLLFFFFQDAEGFAIFSPSNHLFCLPIPPSPVLPIFISNEEWPNFFMDDTIIQISRPAPGLSSRKVMPKNRPDPYLGIVIIFYSQKYRLTSSFHT